MVLGPSTPARVTLSAKRTLRLASAQDDDAFSLVTKLHLVTSESGEVGLRRPALDKPEATKLRGLGRYQVQLGNESSWAPAHHAACKCGAPMELVSILSPILSNFQRPAGAIYAIGANTGGDGAQLARRLLPRLRQRLIRQNLRPLQLQRLQRDFLLWVQPRFVEPLQPPLRFDQQQTIDDG